MSLSPVSKGFAKEMPDHHDAELVLKLYDLRREAVMRESREQINSQFWPRNEAEALAILKHDHPLNRQYRQTSTYWEMVYGFARHGVVHPDFLVENNGEGLLLYARMEPFLEQVRQAGNPHSFRNAEWIVAQSRSAQAIMDRFRPRAKAARTG